jgi:dienelactone hydrolase
MTRSIAVALVVGILTQPLRAQTLTFALRPGPSHVTVAKDVQYGRSDAVSLRMDVYRPSGATTTKRPALIFFNRATGADRSQPFYAAWASAAASRGLVAVLPDLRDGSQPSDFQALVTYLTTRGAELGIDREALAVYAGSGNVYSAFPVVEDPRQTAIKAAVMYYGTGPITEFRRDLPVLYVRAGLDRPDVNKDITTLAALGVSQNAPVTLLNHPSGYHGFEMNNDDDATRDVMEQTIAFVRRVTAPAFQVAMRRGIPEATAAAYVQTREFGKAAPVYAELVRGHPTDTRLRLSYGEALLGDGQFAEACAQFEQLKGKGLGPRDLGLPAARACMQKGDADAAIAWLKTIPSRFLPRDLQDDAVFAPVKDRDDFRSLFAAR